MTKTVFLFINNFQGGGTGGVVATLANNVPENWNAHVITIDDSYFDFAVNNNPLSLHFPRTQKIPEPVYCIWKVPLGVLRYIQLLKKYKPNISMSFLEIENFINLIACIFTNVKPVTSIRANPLSQHMPFFEKILVNINLRLGKHLSRCIITNAEGIKQDVVKKYNIPPEKIKVIYNPKDIEKIDALKYEDLEEPFYNTDKQILITTGRLTQVKGQWHLIRVFYHLQKVIPSKLVICGDGPLKEYLQFLTRELGISKNVLFTGWVHNPYKYIQNSDLFVFPSLSEGQPNSLIDALIVGCPILSSDCNYGPKEILDSGKYGILFQTLDGKYHEQTDALTESETEMLNKIIQILLNKQSQDRLKNLSYERREVFNKERCIAEFFQVFDEISRE